MKDTFNLSIYLVKETTTLFIKLKSTDQSNDNFISHYEID